MKKARKECGESYVKLLRFTVSIRRGQGWGIFEETEWMNKVKIM
jgi:hypothetical protein